MLEYGRGRRRGENTPSLYEFKGQRKDGSLLDLEAAVSTSIIAGRTYIITAIRNIAERKRVELALRESENKYRLLMEQASDSIHTYDMQGNFIETNAKLCEMLGYTHEELLRLDVKDLIPAEDLAVDPIRFDELRAGKSILRERRLRRKDGVLLPVEISGRMIRDNVLQAIIRDITERKQAEPHLRESEERFRAMFEQANVGIVQASFGGTLLRVNPGFCKIVGYAEEEASVMTIRDLTHPDDYQREKALTRQLMKGEIPGYSIEKRYLRKDGSLVWGQMTATLVSQSSGEPFYMLAIVEDISERKQAEESLRSSEAELQKSHEELEQRVGERTVALSGMNAILQEEVRERRRIEGESVELLRRRIAREMHDQFGQQLTVMKLKLDAVKEHCRENENLCEQVDALRTLARQLDEDVDHMVWEMRPTALDDLGLQAALSTYVQNWPQHLGVPVQLHASGMDRIRLTPEIETALYRIAQEALNNIAKHAQAAHVAIVLERRADQVSLIVEDDGVGFDLQQEFGVDDKGLGLIGMRERTTLVGGTLEIESQPNDGATVVVRIPVPPAPETGETDE